MASPKQYKQIGEEIWKTRMEIIMHFRRYIRRWVEVYFFSFTGRGAIHDGIRCSGYTANTGLRVLWGGQ